jgi:hypothetical protein
MRHQVFFLSQAELFMSIAAAWPQWLTFFGTPFVTESSPGQLVCRLIAQGQHPARRSAAGGLLAVGSLLLAWQAPESGQRSKIFYGIHPFFSMGAHNILPVSGQIGSSATSGQLSAGPGLERFLT